MQDLIKRIFNWINYHFFLSEWEFNLLRAKSNKGNTIELLGNSFAYHHGRAFYDTYKEIFVQHILKFNSSQESPYIIDCGSNMGLSLLYFSSHYPKARILAFEPDKTVLPTLKQNMESFALKNVKLMEKAVWSSETELTFYTDKGMGGRVISEFRNSKPEVVQTVRLSDFITKPVAMLKIDIEGAEYTVIKDCQKKLKLVENIFIEYHSSHQEEQHLDDILQILKENGFRYHLKESFSRRSPFVDRRLLCEQYDMAINIFGYK